MIRDRVSRGGEEEMRTRGGRTGDSDADRHTPDSDDD